MVLLNEFRLLEELQGAAPARKYESLARRALGMGHEGVAYIVLSILAQKYLDEGKPRERRMAAANAARLGEARRPANTAIAELEKRFALSSGGPPDHQPDSARGTLAYEILLMSYGPEQKERVSGFRALHERALAEGKHLEAAICDLFLLSEYRSARNRKAERTVMTDLKNLEDRFELRDRDGKLFSEVVASKRK